MRRIAAVATMRGMAAEDIGIDARARAGRTWARGALSLPSLQIEPLAADASFRRYFRLRHESDRWVLMDAPPGQEDLEPFLDVATRLRAASVHAPATEAVNLEQGWLLLEDLGDRLLRDDLEPGTIDRHVPPLFDLLARLSRDVDPAGLPPYDRSRLQAELELFPEWYLGRHRGIRLGCAELDLWEDLGTRLLVSAERQPQVFVHRDFHSCNLLRLEDGGIGVIDFQDAVRGPLTYDFASLVWDRYIGWPRARLETWMEEFRERVAPERPATQWKREVDWMGLQRNLKILGIFARLHHRDGKDDYLDLIPRFWGYVKDVLGRYPEFEEFDRLLERLQCAP